MRSRRSSILVVGVATGVFAIGLSAACGGGDSSGSSPGNDASSGGETSTAGDGGSVDAGGKDSGGSLLTAVVYVNQAATIDATASLPTGASVSWTIMSAPAGSVATITNASTRMPSLTPDVVGDYALSGAVSGGGASTSIGATVHARAGKTFLTHLQMPDAGQFAEIQTARTDGTDRRAISCPGSSLLAAFTAGAVGLDWIEGAPDDDSPVVFALAEVFPDGGTAPYLGAGHMSSSCDAGSPARIDGSMVTFLRLSPDATRVAYVKTNSFGAAHVYTLGLDGSSPHDLGPIAFQSDGGETTNPSATPTPRWTDATHVEWVQFESTPSDWALVSASDTASPSVSTVMTCTATTGTPPTSVTLSGGVTLTPQTEVVEFEPLADGTFLVAAAGAAGSPNAQLNIVVLQPNAGTKACELVRSITSYADVRSYADDFAVSPDRGTVAYLAGIGDGGGVVLYTAPIDGGASTLVPSFGDAGVIGGGPRWAAGGSQLVLSRTGETGGSVITVTPGTGHSDVLVAGSAEDAYAAAGNACSVSLRRTTPIAAISFAGLFVGLIVRRRRRRGANPLL